MNTRVHTVSADGQAQAAVREAIDCLAAGGLVVFPTETVYGVAALASHAEGLNRLRELKGRQDGKPFTVHIGQRAAVPRFVPELAGAGRRLVKKAWPGPITLIFQVERPEEAEIVRAHAPELVSALYHEGSIGIRCPDHHLAAEFLAGAPGPVVAASANLAGQAPPTSGEEALATLGGRVDLAIDAGRCRYAQASTIVRVNREGFEVLREGVISERVLRKLAMLNILLVCSGNTCRSPMAMGLLRKLLAERLGCSERELIERGIHVESAGTSAFGGSSAASGAIKALRARGIDISGHRSQPVNLEMINRADLILALTAAHREAMAAMVPGARDRIILLGDLDIEDPIGAGDDVYDACAENIERALQHRLEEIPL